MASAPAVRTLLLAAALIVWTVAPPSSAQDLRLPRDEYFRLIGMYGEYSKLEQFLFDKLSERIPETTKDRRRETSAFFAYVMTANGITARTLAALEAEGIDVVHAITSDARPFSEQALLADLVVVGDAIGEAAPETDDGYGSSVLVKVHWTLKGEAPGDTVIIRQRQRLEGRGNPFRPETGETYLLLLSNGLYRYGAANHAARNKGWLPSAEPAPYYIIYRIYKMIDGRLDWGGFTRHDTERAFEDVRRVNHLLSVYSNEDPREDQ